MIKLLAHLDTQEWSIEGSPGSNDLELVIGCRRNNAIGVDFVNASFGFNFLDQEGILDYAQYPPEGISYSSTNEDFMTYNFITDLVPEEEYVIRAWFKDSGIEFSAEFTITTPRPEQPFPSWTYSEEMRYWIAPYPPNIPKTDDQYYSWNEDTQLWSVLDK